MEWEAKEYYEAGRKYEQLCSLAKDLKQSHAQIKVLLQTGCIILSFIVVNLICWFFLVFRHHKVTTFSWISSLVLFVAGVVMVFCLCRLYRSGKHTRAAHVNLTAFIHAQNETLRLHHQEQVLAALKALEHGGNKKGAGKADFEDKEHDS